MSIKDIEEATRLLESQGYTDLQAVSCRYWKGKREIHKEDLKVTKE